MPDQPPPPSALLREHAPYVLAAIVRRFGDFGASEDAVQEALVAAALRWPKDGIPDDPRAWLIRVASRRTTDQLRAEGARRHREDIVASLVPVEEQLVLPPDGDGAPSFDDTLDLLFMCCHPALSAPSAIALTLRAVGGLTTSEIAKAFLVSEATMAQRISRAKQTLRTSGIPLELPDAAERAARLEAVTHVLYLMFSEGYTASSGSALHRPDLSAEALRLTRLLHRLVEDAEVAGLLALMLLTDARRAARTGAAGELVPLDEQDRASWDRDAIAEGVAILTSTLSRGTVGTFQLQASIAAIHDQAERPEDTDWVQILGLYRLLQRIADNPMVALQIAVATAMVHGPRAGLECLKGIAGDARLREGHRLDAVRAHLLERAGEHDAAAVHYSRAAQRVDNVPERNYLLMRAARTASRR
jgi:RNA polymerase sigma factor (sigma-70 family)